MAKFIELTNFSNQRIVVNVENILWVQPYEKENGSIIYVAVTGRNDYPVCINVIESYNEVSLELLK